TAAYALHPCEDDRHGSRSGPRNAIAIAAASIKERRRPEARAPSIREGLRRRLVQSDLDAAGLLLTHTVGRRHPRIGLTTARRRDVGRRDALVHQVVPDRSGAARGQALVVADRTGAVRMADRRDRAGIQIAEGADDVVEDRDRVWPE